MNSDRVCHSYLSELHRDERSIVDLNSAPRHHHHSQWYDDRTRGFLYQQKGINMTDNEKIKLLCSAVMKLRTNICIDGYHAKLPRNTIQKMMSHNRKEEINNIIKETFEFNIESKGGDDA